MFYHNGHRSNAHLGIHHPFGAKHGTPVPLSPAGGSDGRPLHERMYAPSAAELLRRPVPQPPDAPLHDRLYPESYEEYFARITAQGHLHAANEHGSALTDAGGRPFDAEHFRRDHARNDHRDLLPYAPELDAPVPYYRIGVRPLSGSKKIPHRYFNVGYNHPEHMHFLGSDGGNFGFTPGDSGNGELFSESLQELSIYLVEPRKYRKDYIDKARIMLEKEWETVEQIASQHDTEISRYYLFLNNCQHYAAKILRKADALATADGVSLVIGN